MRYTVTMKVLGILLMFFSLSMLTPIPVSWHYHNHIIHAFVAAFAITFAMGFVLWILNCRAKAELRTRDGFLIVFLIWAVLGLFGALPLIISPQPDIPWSDAIFESISGLTTTGATSLTHIDTLPKAILYYRQQLQFLGGMGIIVLAVAIMPLIGVGGMQLYRAETTGPMKDNKLTPRITETAKALWLIYVGFTIACFFAYWACGMTLFDALCYAFSTVSTGGYAPHDASIAYYHSNGVYLVSIVFMILGGINFSLHFLAFRRWQFKAYWHNAELRGYLLILLFVSVVVAATLLIEHTTMGVGQTIMASVYQVVSFMTTTGFVQNDHYVSWPLFVPILLMLIGLLGSCSGSTTGGIKVIRMLLFQRQISREIKRLIHPHGMFPLKLGNQLIPERVMAGVWAFLSAYIMIFVVLWLVLMATGLTPITAFSALAACLSNAGPGLGAVANNFGTISGLDRSILALAMLVGRLEVFTVLVLLSPSFWRR